MQGDTGKAILKQLGGAVALYTIGARNFVTVEPGIVFDLPGGFARNGADKVRIARDEDGTHTVEFMCWGARNRLPHTVAEFDGIHRLMLRSLFRQQTGLEIPTLSSVGRVA